MLNYCKDNKFRVINFQISTILTVNVYLSEPPNIPELTLTYDIVEGHESRIDRYSTCTADVGYPPGYIVIYSDIDGEMTELLSSNQLSNEFANVVYNISDSSDGCIQTRNVSFAFKQVKMNINRRKIRCITIPSKNYIGGQQVKSKDETIKVVPSRFLVLSKYFLYFEVIFDEI